MSMGKRWETREKHLHTPSTMPATVLMARCLEWSLMGSTLLRTAMTKKCPATVNWAASLHRHMHPGGYLCGFSALAGRSFDAQKLT